MLSYFVVRKVKKTHCIIELCGGFFCCLVGWPAWFGFLRKLQEYRVGELDLRGARHFNGGILAVPGCP